MFLVTFKLALINALYQVNFAVSIRQLQIYRYNIITMV